MLLDNEIKFSYFFRQTQPMSDIIRKDFQKISASPNQRIKTGNRKLS